ncbi:hypothetical protein ALC53_09615 [Atta colombica]|uniref:Uncharacterized protein n=1 Tax=Atta colombica TaxID=520822 RepID=A0A151I1C2_9HYME|nr:hypothetical protein ALC53_09615 [Atta colombica]
MAIEKRFSIQRTEQRARLCLVGNQKGPSTVGRCREGVGDRKGRHAGDVGGDANSAFNKVSRGCHLNIVAYSLFSSSPREEETEGW